MAEKVDWEKTRTNRWSKAPAPPEWDSAIQPISMEGLTLLGINTETGALHWDGREISIKKTISLGIVERLAIVAAALATVGLFIIELGKALKTVCT